MILLKHEQRRVGVGVQIYSVIMFELAHVPPMLYLAALLFLAQ